MRSKERCDMKTKLTFLVCCLITLVFYGCTPRAKYGCPYEQGVTCKSLSTVYKDSLTGELEKSIVRQKQLRNIKNKNHPDLKEAQSKGLENDLADRKINQVT